MYTRRQLRREAALTEADLEEIRQCRRPHNRLGFAYQLSLVRLLNRFPYQQPFEVVEELAIFTSVQLAVDGSLLEQVSPIAWDNVVLYGQYVLNRKLIKRRRAVA